MLINFGEMILDFSLKIKGIIHLGASELEELQDYLKNGVAFDNIVWVEGQEMLVTKMKGIYPSAKIYNKVLSGKDGDDVEFIITNNSQSSSILELDLHKQMHPHVFEVNRYKVTTTTMDTFIKEEKLDMNRYNFLNLDLQGVELSVLQGMKDNLKYIDYIYSEVNEKHLYKDCGLINEVDDFLKNHGFKRVKTVMLGFGWGECLYIRN